MDDYILYVLECSIMVTGTLNELSKLRDSGFGQPPPRHGLNLLYWFAKEYIDFDGVVPKIVPKVRPEKGDFGFKKFQNRIEDEDRIVPIQDLPYYKVGNLNDIGADKLPHYVRANYKQKNPESNKDRIIVHLDKDKSIDRVYVTEHSDKISFANSKTYRVSQGLLKIIKNSDREGFLSSVTKKPDISAGFHYQQQSFRRPSPAPPPPQNDSWCTIL